jgi:organic hydroperoxide reductase OsmC/OhrA
MTALKREATIRWLDHPPGGTPRLTVGSESLTPSLPLNVDPDAAHPLAASPGELLAGAIGSVFAWIAAEELVAAGTPARELTASVTLTMSGHEGALTDLALSAIACSLAARIPGIGEQQLGELSRRAMTSCLSALRLEREPVEVSVTATLEGA